MICFKPTDRNVTQSLIFLKVVFILTCVSVCVNIYMCRIFVLIRSCLRIDSFHSFQRVVQKERMARRHAQTSVLYYSTTILLFLKWWTCERELLTQISDWFSASLRVASRFPADRTQVIRLPLGPGYSQLHFH